LRDIEEIPFTCDLKFVESIIKRWTYKLLSKRIVSMILLGKKNPLKKNLPDCGGRFALFEVGSTEEMRT
jgi:hypothetical protein